MSTSPFLVPIRALPRSDGGRRHEQRRGRIDGLKVTGSAVAPQSEVEVDVVLEAAGGGIVVTGSVGADWTGDCRRCLGPVNGHLEAEVREVYERRHGGGLDPPDADEDTYPLTGEMLDLLPLARDAVLLDLPAAPLCRPDCAGLCPSCGANRNEERCRCPDEASDPRWAALDALSGRDSS